MAQQTLSQARIQDPILTAVARGYRSQKPVVANALFPIVSVTARGGRILKFDADNFKLVSTARAPGANTKRVQYTYGTENFSLVDHRLEALVPVELSEEGQVAGIDIVSTHINRVQDQMAIEREKMAADLARNASLYAASNKETLSGTSQWSNTASDPFIDIIEAKEAIRGQIGEEPNTLALGPKVLTALRTHPKVLDRLSTATDRVPATLAQLASLFELELIVKGGAVYSDGTPGLKDVWGKDAILAYTTPASMQDMGSPSFGYTYQLAGRPIVEEGYWEGNVNSWAYPVNDAYQPVLAGAAAGFLFVNAVA